MVTLAGFEPSVTGLKGRVLKPLEYRAILLWRKMWDSNPVLSHATSFQDLVLTSQRHFPFILAIEEGFEPSTLSSDGLAIRSNTIMGLYLFLFTWWREEDLNLRSRETSDLQSGALPLGHLSTSNWCRPGESNSENPASKADMYANSIRAA